MHRREQRQPGVSRGERLGDEGLARLEQHLAAGMRIAPAVRAQWIKRYGEAARTVLRRHGQYSPDLEAG